MSEIYVLTKAGKRAYKDNSLSEDEMRAVEYLKGCRSASSDKLEEIGIEGWLLRSMKRHGLIKELTT
jgi:hypothetical protein